MVSTADSTALLSDDSSALADLRVPEMHAPWRFGGTAPEARSAPWISTIGIVAIGRNEGDRLKRCIGSLNALHDRTVYVDSGSSDGSVAMSRLAGVSVVELDMSMPFTAGRARNAGFKRLAGVHPDIEYVFFVDGDCEVVAGWLETAVRFLDEHRNVAAVFGGRRERHPHKTIYNMLCDLEWQDCPLGETKACGGDAVMRVSAYRQANGYRADLICGEEPELCLRMREAGWKIWRIRQDMTLHDVAMDRFSQWWNRSVRSGYGFAQGVRLHGDSPARHWVLESHRAWVWGLWVPALILLLSVTLRWQCLVLLLVYPLQIVRLALRGKYSARQNWWRAAALVLSKFPEMVGQIRFVRDRFACVQSRLIEYK